MQLGLPLTPADLAMLDMERAQFRDAAPLSPLTRRGYNYDWAAFETWCAAIGRCPLSSTTDSLSLYLTFLLHHGKKVSTCRRHLASLRHHLCKHGVNILHHELDELLDGAQRLRAETLHQMKPLKVKELRHISVALRREGTMKALRDRALLVLGFTTALRRSNLAALTLADIELSRDRLIVHVGREKQDQMGKGRLIGIPGGRNRDTCAVRCLRAWLRERGRNPGPLFFRLTPARFSQPLDGNCVLRIVKHAVKRIGLDPALYGPHSLRSGFITAAGERGLGELLIASQTGHRSTAVLRRYFRRTELFRANACALLDL